MDTFPKLNEDIVAALRVSDSPIKKYAALRIEELEAEQDALLTACENVAAALNCKYDSATIEAEYGEQLRTLTKGD